MNILLFNQYFTSKKDKPEINLISLPLNLLCLATFLKSKNLDCKIYELGISDPKEAITEESNRLRFGISDEKIVEIIKREEPKLIGLGCMYSRHYIDIVNIARLIKKIDPQIIVITGGNHATALYEMVLKNHNFDFVVRGEGEITFHELCESILEKENDFSQIKGLAYRDKDKIILTPDRELIPDLDDLPMLDYDLIDLKKYISLNKSVYNLRHPSMGIISSRGCPGNCIYCTVRAVWGRTWRGKSPKRTVDEIELLHQKYGIREFSFLDDSASVSKTRWNEICDEIIRRKLDIKWTTPNGIAHWTLDKPTLLKMKKSGCYRITFGIESGNPEIRKFIGKPYLLSQAKELIQYANKIGMWTICTHIVGFPDETPKQMRDTVNFAKKSGTDFAAFYALCPMPTAEIYQYLKKEGLLNYDFLLEGEFDEEKHEMMSEMFNGAPTKYFKPVEVREIAMKFYRSFMVNRALKYLLNPFHLLKKIRSLEDLRYMSRLGLAGIKMLLKTFYVKNTRNLLYGRVVSKKI